MTESAIASTGIFRSREVPMHSKQKLLDSLTAHISFYHSAIPTRNPSLGQRPAILRWFSSLSVHQRCAHLTMVDRNFISILLQMREKLQSQGPGRFIILPDLPQNDDSSLPTLCYRKSEGFLLRISSSNQVEREIYDSVELFSSREGEDNDCSAQRLDAMIISECLVGDVDRFVKIMDEITSGEFLTGGEEGEMAGEWVELGWLKGKGYYSLQEFVVNRIEVGLRLAWLNSNSGKKRGLKLKERLLAVGTAANLFWRKKGCVDWWDKLDGSMKKKLFSAYMGKAAKSMTVDLLKGKDHMSDDRLGRCDYNGERPLGCNLISLGRRDHSTFKRTDIKAKQNTTNLQVSENPSRLDCMFNSLYILQVITTLLLASQQGEYDKGKLFFSSLDCVNSISDIILRKLRGLLMIISLDCTKFELLGDGKKTPLTKKLDEKPVADKRKKKGKNRNKKSNPVPKPSNNDAKPGEPNKGRGDGLVCCSSKDEARVSCKFDCEVLENNYAQELVKEVNNGKLQSAPRKNRKSRKKLRSTESGSCQLRSNGDCSASVSSQNGPTTSGRVSGTSTLVNMSNNVVGGNDRLDTHINSFNSVMAQRSDITCSSETNGHQSVKHHQKSGSTGLNTGENSGDDSLNYDVDSPVATIKPVEYNDDMSGVSYADSYQNCSKSVSKSIYFGRKKTGDAPEGKPCLIQEQGGLGVLRVGAINLPAYVSYEWPNVAHLNPSATTHLPAATDRLHLDVGNNWQNHFHHSFVQTVQVRNSPIDHAYNGMISRPFSMNLDWPPTVCGNRLVPSVTCNYDSEFISRRQSSLQRGFTAKTVQRGAASSEDERTIASDLMDFSDFTASHEIVDEQDKHWMSEDELEASGMDYNQYFGGGVMYWDPSDHPGPSFSRPPSLCSDDSSWAWREADMNRAVDDMVASSYSTNGLTSPSTASFCSLVDPLGSGSLGYVVPGNEISGMVLHSSTAITDAAEEGVSGSTSNVTGNVEVKNVDSLPYPILRPIIVSNISRERLRSDFTRGYDHKSPCVPPNRREHPCLKRPPSPVVLCVPHAPRPPPLSPAVDARRLRGFPTVRSGSSSPRHWGVKGWLHDGVSFEEACIPVDGSEVVWPPWRNKGISARQLTQPLPGKLLQDRLLAISQLARDQEHPDVTFPLQPPESHTVSLSNVHDTLHVEIDTFCKQVAAENLIRKPYINWAVKRVARSLQVLWPRSRTNVFGSNATGLSLPSSDVDLVVCLPPVRNLEPIKEAGILEGRNGIKETCLQHAARYLANQEWVKSDSLKTVENTAIPIIMLVVIVPNDVILSTLPNVQTPKEETDQAASEDADSFQTDAGSSESSISPKWCKITNDTDRVKAVRLDISFKSPTHTGLQTTGLVKDLTERFPAVTPLTLVLKQFLADRSLDQSYSGGLNSYCLILMITRFLQHEHHHSRSNNQNYGSLLMDFLYFFGNVFDPRQMRISVQGSGVYLNRERGCSIDPLYIDDPLFLTNNVGRNCFRIHQCIKAFADAYAILENELTCLPNNEEKDAKPTCKLLPKIIPSIGHLVGS